MATMEVLPHPTPPEWHEVRTEIEVDDRLADMASLIEDWTTPRQAWEFLMREGTDFGKANNVEITLTYADGEETTGFSFRIEQLDRAEDTGEELVLVFEERDGIAKLARLRGNGLDLELFHILTFT